MRNDPAATAGDDVGLSVVIPAYNASKYIAECLTSVLAQEDAPPFEVIVVDDGSHDDTAGIVARDFPSVRLIRKPNGGPGSARNRGVAEARGEVIVFMDADDVMLPGRLAFQGNFMLENPHVGLSVANCQYQRKPDFDRFRAHNICDHVEFRVVEDAYRKLLTRFHFVGGSSCSVRKKIYQEMGGQPEDVFVGEDLEMGLKIAAKWPLAACCRPLILVRQDHGGNLMSSPHTYQDPVIVVRRHLLEYKEFLSPDDLRKALKIFNRRADVLLRNDWAVDGRGAVIARLEQLRPLLPRTLEMKWRIGSFLPSWIGIYARRTKRWTQARLKLGRAAA